jgi:hypothetical protein
LLCFAYPVNIGFGVFVDTVGELLVFESAEMAG